MARLCSSVCPSLFPLAPSPVHSSNSVPFPPTHTGFLACLHLSAHPFSFSPLVWPPYISTCGHPFFHSCSLPSAYTPTSTRSSIYFSPWFLPPLSACHRLLLQCPIHPSSCSYLSLHVPSFSYAFVHPLVPLFTRFQRLHLSVLPPSIHLFKLVNLKLMRQCT